MEQPRSPVLRPFEASLTFSQAACLPSVLDVEADPFMVPRFVVLCCFLVKTTRPQRPAIQRSTTPTPSALNSPASSPLRPTNPLPSSTDSPLKSALNAAASAVSSTVGGLLAPVTPAPKTSSVPEVKVLGEKEKEVAVGVDAKGEVEQKVTPWDVSGSVGADGVAIGMYVLLLSPSPHIKST